ncbi:S4 domain-containing protein [Alkalihalobacillus sp. AL-G]|uniref:S4 domain-containing protein n=1 Tax=Alkalihalobacillus sp. AL-G TaxID=2926399 RepID=UPI00272C2A55|nr:S4 domain-containing protein [Alkalihalobacillus sp. AL-G]WLD93775.1 cytoplasmic protein [Alkalihalobacillus sp. AL-G]
MQIEQLTWNLNESNTETTELRHCSNCGKTVLFTDTRIRRHNANGKNIYRFAIYKCEKNHTWNKKLESYRSYSGHARVIEERNTETNEHTKLPIRKYLGEGAEQIQITLEEVKGKFRLDKILSEHTGEWSRTEIAGRIMEGKILVNDRTTKPATKLKKSDKITILL